MTTIKATIEAMTRTELMKVLDGHFGQKDMRRMTQKQMASIWLTMQPKEEPKVEEPVVTAAPKAKKGKEPKECKCGCLGMTKGGTFLPGHDAKYHAMLMPSKHAPKECRCGCGGTTKGGFYLPGHDAKHFSFLLKVSRGTEQAVPVNNPTHSAQGRLMALTA